MARWRKKNDDWVEPFVQLVGLLFLLSLLSPTVRQTISAIGIGVICLLSLVAVGVIGLGIYQVAARSRQEKAGEQDFDRQPSDTGNEAAEREWRAVLSPAQTSTELIEQLRNIDWFQFEELVALIYRKSGYTVIRRGGANPDGGIDLLIERDGLQQAVQCKHWKSWNVGVKAIREFLGALTDAGIQRGIFITLCGYTGDAKHLAEKHQIDMVNEAGLARMIENTDARFDPEALAVLNGSRKICPKCESEMVLRTVGRGIGAGQQFWGCSAYPRCRFTMPA